MTHSCANSLVTLDTLILFHCYQASFPCPVSSNQYFVCVCVVCLQYGIVLDAGSSHTSLFIYKWPADKENGTGVVTQHSECHAEGKNERSNSGRVKKDPRLCA